MNIGAYTIIRNEAHWIGFCLMAAKDLVSEFVYFDGNSTDGTPELIEYVAKKYGVNARVVRDQDPRDLKDDYVRVFNECLNSLTTDYAWFLHPDMIVVSHNGLPAKGPYAFYTNMESFGGDPRGEIIKFSDGRTDKWKNIMLRDFGLHYYGHYGVHNEDMYFRDITGDEHEVATDLGKYPYAVMDSGIHVQHYSDVRPYERRLQRMTACILNENPWFQKEAAIRFSESHPRVTFKTHDAHPRFKMERFSEFPDVFSKYNSEFAYVVGRSPSDFCLLPLNASGGNVHKNDLSRIAKHGGTAKIPFESMAAGVSGVVGASADLSPNAESGGSVRNKISAETETEVVPQGKG